MGNEINSIKQQFQQLERILKEECCCNKEVILDVLFLLKMSFQYNTTEDFYDDIKSLLDTLFNNQKLLNSLSEFDPSRLTNRFNSTFFYRSITNNNNNNN